MTSPVYKYIFQLNDGENIPVSDANAMKHKADKVILLRLFL